MLRTYRYLDVERRGDLFCVRLRRSRLDEAEVYEASAELMALVVEDGCRRMALALGPERLECLYSVFLAKLITLQRELTERGGELTLCEAGPEVRNIFAACGLDDRFRFLPDFEAATAAGP
jgi:anti-anti-sigma factor